MDETKEANEAIKNTPCEGCGNGSIGHGFPGERQVNSAEQDIDNAPNITQSETTIAACGPFILMGFNDFNEVD
jgi:hypothetical protein